MKEIRLSSGEVALVDDEDYPLLSRHSWCLIPSGNCLYAATVFNSKAQVFMHRLIMGPVGSKAMIDHLDGNGLNNQKVNLRIATNSANQQNRHWGVRSSSGYRGVFWASTHKRWQAQIKKDGKTTYLGQFRDKEEAARAYDAAALRMFGPDAYTNFKAVGVEIPT